MKMLVEDLDDPSDSDAMRRVRRARRRLVQDGLLVTGSQFCLRAGIAEDELRSRVRRRSIFTLRLGRRTYYPSLFFSADGRRFRLLSRVERVTRAMRPEIHPWTAYFELVHAFESQGGKTLQQVMRRGTGYRSALRYARGVGASQKSFKRRDALRRA